MDIPTLCIFSFILSNITIKYQHSLSGLLQFSNPDITFYSYFL